uniref:Selenoprotein W n=1 Tax=Calcidiscus leptoporus TaxID=127549 RepID=A0A7S0NPF3_9EUKA
MRKPRKPRTGKAGAKEMHAFRSLLLLWLRPGTAYILAPHRGLRTLPRPPTFVPLAVAADTDDSDDVELLCRLPRVSIEYCSQCNWMLRSAWLSQELLTTFNGTIREVALQPNHAGGGVFVVSVADEEGEAVVWDRREQERFPEAKELKQLVRDVLQPGRSLGHSDKPAEARSSAQTAVSRLLGLLAFSGRPRRRRDS